MTKLILSKVFGMNILKMKMNNFSFFLYDFFYIFIIYLFINYLFINLNGWFPNLQGDLKTHKCRVYYIFYKLVFLEGYILYPKDKFQKDSDIKTCYTRAN